MRHAQRVVQRGHFGSAVGHLQTLPGPPSVHDRLPLVAENFRALCYSERTCRALLGTNARWGSPLFYQQAGEWRPASNSLELCVELFAAGRIASRRDVDHLLDVAFVDALVGCELLEVTSTEVRAVHAVVPVADCFFATDWPSYSASLNPVMPVFGETYALGRIARTTKASSTLDLCTGCGVHAILAARRGGRCLGVDISPRAIEFANFNRELNNCSNVRFVAGDLFSPIERSERFGHVFVNPPYNPDPLRPAGSTYFSGGARGSEILERVLMELPERLLSTGVCDIITLMLSEKGMTFLDRVASSRLGAELDLMAQTFELPEYVDWVPEFAPYLREHFTGFSFGLLSARLAPGGRQPVHRQIHLAGRAFADDLGRLLGQRNAFLHSIA